MVLFEREYIRLYWRSFSYKERIYWKRKMKSYALALVALSSLVSGCFVSQVAGADNTVVWTELAPHVEAAKAQRWTVKKVPAGAKKRDFEFSALRFHLGYYELRLVDIAESSNSMAARIARDQRSDKEFPELFELGVRAVFKTNPFSAQAIAVAPAGFPASNRNPTNLGLLKIHNHIKSGLLQKGPRAILCLNNARSGQYQFQVRHFSGLIDQINDN